MTDADDRSASLASATVAPHAYHLNLPSNWTEDDGNGSTNVLTEYARRQTTRCLKLIDSIRLTEESFTMEENDDHDEEHEEENGRPTSLSSLVVKCGRAEGQLKGLRRLKHLVLSDDEVCRIVASLMRLLCATVVRKDCSLKLIAPEVAVVVDASCEKDPFGDRPDVDPRFRVDRGRGDFVPPDEDDVSFALPPPARARLFDVVLDLLNASRESLSARSNKSLRIGGPRLVVDWRALYRLVTRTVPHADAQGARPPPRAAASRGRDDADGAAELARACRKYYWQRKDDTSTRLWRGLRRDVLHHAHSNAHARALLLLHTFLPSRASPSFYASVVPEWVAAWTATDRCNEADACWLGLLSRARRWAPPDLPARALVRSQCLAWIARFSRVPVAGTSFDASAPAVGSALPSRDHPGAFWRDLKGGDEARESIDRACRWLASEMGRGEIDDKGVSEGTLDVVRFLTFTAPYCDTSNAGPWTVPLAALLVCLTGEVTRRIVWADATRQFAENHPDAPRPPYDPPIPPADVAAFVHAALPSCRQASCSRHAGVSSAGRSCVTALSRVDPALLGPSACWDFCEDALDVSGLHRAHQAPVALDAARAFVRDALRDAPADAARRLPRTMELSLRGVDGNDGHKTTRTLGLVAAVVGRVPVGRVEYRRRREESEEEEEGVSIRNGTVRFGRNLWDDFRRHNSLSRHRDVLSRLPTTSPLYRSIDDDGEGEEEDVPSALASASLALSSRWVLLFLERLFERARSAGEREKAGRRLGGDARRRSAADARRADEASRTEGNCARRVFASLRDEETRRECVAAVATFVRRETLPFAVKDVAALCGAACSEGGGAEDVWPALTDGDPGESDRALAYRTRCLAGAVARAGAIYLRHESSVTDTLRRALERSSTRNGDETVFKAGCKLLRRAIESQCTTYVMRERPVVVDDSAVGRAASLRDDPVTWHTPTGAQIDAAGRLWDRFVTKRWTDLSRETVADPAAWVRALKVTRAALRGCADLLLEADVAERAERGDAMDASDHGADLAPAEIAAWRLLRRASPNTRALFQGLRGRLCAHVTALLSFTSARDDDDEETENDPSKRGDPARSLAADVRLRSQLVKLARFLLTQRTVNDREDVDGDGEARSMSAALCDRLATLQYRAGILTDASNHLHRDGEDGGAHGSRYALEEQVAAFARTARNQARYAVPRRLRIRDLRRNRAERTTREPLFSEEVTVDGLLSRAAAFSETAEPPPPLVGYDGLLDGLVHASCAGHAKLRRKAHAALEAAVPLFKWVVRERLEERAWAAASSRDETSHRRCGLPSVARLSARTDSAGRRRAAEVLRGACALLTMPAMIARCDGGDEIRRRRLIEVLTGPALRAVAAAAPPEEAQKLVETSHAVFSGHRTRWYDHRVADARSGERAETVDLVTRRLDPTTTATGAEGETKEKEEDAESDARSPPRAAAEHWRNRLVLGWFLITSIDRNELSRPDRADEILGLCLRLLATERAQPLQRVALGLLGRVVSLSGNDSSLFDRRSSDPSFPSTLSHALVHDHRDDETVGGGHGPQWSAGVENLLRDSARHLAPAVFFPLVREWSRSEGGFKTAHARLVRGWLGKLTRERRNDLCERLLEVAKTLAKAGPSEDQKNQVVTSAEIFASVARTWIMDDEDDDHHSSTVADFLETVVPVVPAQCMPAFHAALRYVAHLAPLRAIHRQLLVYSIDRAVRTLAPTSTEGLSVRSRRLYVTAAAMGKGIVAAAEVADPRNAEELLEAFRPAWALVCDQLTPALLQRIDHPYEECRGMIAACLFGVCRTRECVANVVEGAGGSAESLPDPSPSVVERFATITSSAWPSPQRQLHATSTAFHFLILCVSYGNAALHVKKYAVPLLPSAFEATRVPDDAAADDPSSDPSLRALRAEVADRFRAGLALLGTAVPLRHREGDRDLEDVLDVVARYSADPDARLRRTAAHAARCLQGSQRFARARRAPHVARITSIVTALLGDARRDVSTAALEALTGTLAGSDDDDVAATWVERHVGIAERSLRRLKDRPNETEERRATRERRRATRQQTSVFVLCAAVSARPYDTPDYVPEALRAVSRHSFDRSAPANVREVVRKCCRDYKRTHTDNWEWHRARFTQTQYECFQDVVDTPHYYA